MDVTVKDKTKLAILFFLLVFVPLGYAQSKASTEIPYLLNLIKTSSFIFERNGQNGSGKSAAELLQFKFNQSKNKIHTAEDFIENVASFSGHTMKSYHVILPGGEKILLKDLLYAELGKLRGQAKE